MNRESKDIVVLGSLIIAMGIGCFLLGTKVNDHNREVEIKIQDSIMFTLEDDEEGMPSEGDLMRVQYTDDNRVYMCVID